LRGGDGGVLEGWLAGVAAGAGGADIPAHQTGVAASANPTAKNKDFMDIAN